MVRANLQDRFAAWLNDRPDETVLRGLFGVVLAATIGVVGLDAYDWATAPAPTILTSPSKDAPSTGMPSAQPLPAVRPRNGERRSAPLRQKDPRLQAAMSFELAGDGRLIAVGGIELPVVASGGWDGEGCFSVDIRVIETPHTLRLRTRHDGTVHLGWRVVPLYGADPLDLAVRGSALPRQH